MSPTERDAGEPQLELCHQLRDARKHHKPTERGSSRLRSLRSSLTSDGSLKPLKRELPSTGSIHSYSLSGLQQLFPAKLQQCPDSFRNSFPR